jgi:hypothetical protein
VSSSSNRGPNPVGVLWSVVRSLAARRPRPAGTQRILDTASLATVLERLQASGIGGLEAVHSELLAFRDAAQEIDPDHLDRDTALAFWLNLYNAGALDLATRATAASAGSVLRVPGGFRETWAVIAGEKLSLDRIEHGKIRRFKDPRIHGALVCGSASCPTLRYEPYSGDALDGQLDDQIRTFFAGGGVTVSEDRGDGRQVLLSRILLWYGNDFVRPHRMPVFIPATKAATARSVAGWLPVEAAAALDSGARVAFQPYDWSLACPIG